MEIVTYNNLEDFKENYLIDFSLFSDEIKYINYLQNLKKSYKNLLIKLNENRGNLYYSEYGIRQSKNLSNIIGSDFNHIESEIEKLIRSNWQDTQILQQRILTDEYLVLNKINLIIDEKKQRKHEELINEYINERFTSLLRMRDYFDNHIEPIEEILDFINFQIDSEKVNLLRFQNIQTQSKDEPEPLTTNQTKKIGLLIRSGIIDFLREKNPKISDNQIAGFIQLLSKEPLKQNSINPHLSKTNSKYAIQNKQDENDLDLILKQFGISPQSE